MTQNGTEHIRIDKDIESGDSQKDASVLNYGTITAAQAELKSAGGNLNALAINNAGVIRATGSKTVNGPQG